MSYVANDLRRDVLRACNKARVSMSPDDIQTALTDISEDVEAWQNPGLPPPPPADSGDTVET